jgi:uncharacterized membrane protein
MPRSSRDNLLARTLEPFVASLWILFVIVSVLVGLVWTMGIGEGNLERWVSNADLRAALTWLLAHLDLAWITLAAANAYLSLVGTVGLSTARPWALGIVVAVTVAAWVSVGTGIPFGHIRYGSALGLKMGPVPLGLPLLWFSIIIGAREAVLWFRPRWGQVPLAIAVGALAIITDWNLEFLAARLRGFWFWSGVGPGEPPVYDFPWSGTLAWGVISGVITFALRELHVSDPTRKPWRAMTTLAIFELVFVATHVAHRLNY